MYFKRDKIKNWGTLRKTFWSATKETLVLQVVQASYFIIQVMLSR